MSKVVYIKEQVVVTNTPTPPSTGFIKFYRKTDGIWYQLNSEGVETSISGDVVRWVDDFERSNTTPNQIGQLGIQIDTFDIYVSVGTNVGEWVNTSPPKNITIITTSGGSIEIDLVSNNTFKIVNDTSSGDISVSLKQTNPSEPNFRSGNFKLSIVKGENDTFDISFPPTWENALAGIDFTVPNTNFVFDAIVDEAGFVFAQVTPFSTQT